MRSLASLALLCVLLLALPAATGSAQARAAVPPDQLLDRLLDDALAEYERGHWTQAQTLLERAHLLRPSARTLRGLGFTAFHLRQYAAAIARLEASLQARVRPLDAPLREQVRDVIARAEPYVARLRVVLRPASSVLTVDGAPAARDTEGRVILDLGVHRLRAAAPGFVAREQRLVVTDSQPRALELPLAAPSSSPAAPAAQLRQRRLMWSAAGTAAVTAVGALASWWAADRRYAELEASCAQRGGCFEQDIDGREVTRLDRTSWALWGVSGAAALTAAITGLVLERRGARRAGAHGGSTWQ